jgi:hypothetical protein
MTGELLWFITFRFNYVAVIDMDEIILPKQPEAKTWRSILEDKTAKETLKTATSICFYEQQMIKTTEALQILANAINPTSEDKELIDLHRTGSHYFLTRVHSVNTQHGGLVRPKCFHKLDMVVSVNAHDPTACVGNNERAMGSCNGRMVSEDVARSFHYRSVCDERAKGEVALRVFPCTGKALEQFKFEKDTTVWKFKDELRTAMDTVLHVLRHV